ncbi:biliverdin-producing heme oxygenase [Bradyrhizobium lablabi]|nr:biliverdin-producing heme oxygenase [Bradyrhizobium lablabi]
MDSRRFAGPVHHLRTTLKAATAADHARLDGRLSAFDLTTLAGYRNFLEVNAAALLPLEAALVVAGVRQVLPDWDRRARSHAILNDLARIGGRSQPLDPPALADRFAALGTLYVLEGSRLGAAYLLKHVRRAADPRIVGATCYLAHGVGQNLWASFLAVLESHAPDLVDEDDIVASARRAFDLFARAAVLS